MARAAWIIAACLAVAAAAAGAGSAAVTPPRWTAFADCAAYYQVNARLADPSRPASMTAQMSEVGDDYARAAVTRYARQKKASPRAAQHAVVARIKAGVERLAGAPRSLVEREIDRCPQVGN